MSSAIFWFRQDLRCTDNPALAIACENHKKIIPLYIKETHPALPMGGAQLWWLHHSLVSLANTLKKVGLDLCLRTAEPLTLLKELISQYQVETIYWNRCYEPMHRARDQHIETALKKLGVEVVSCNGSLLHEPGEILNQSGTYFKVFTPYWRSCMRQMQVRPLVHIDYWPANQSVHSEQLDDWMLLPTKPNWAKEFAQDWQPGEKGALAKLNHFVTDNITGYKDKRNLPAIVGTSKLSPHLHFGEISPQQVWTAVQSAMHEAGYDLQSAQTYLSELGWREFCYQLLYHYPQLMDSNFKDKFDHFPWRENKAHLSLWQQGLTGYPIVDAGMRELWRTGFMHNRVRMIVASFLTKHLMIDWRKGAAWFLDTLVDADLANNSANWQWVAGSGADASPYYRIFNPVLQGEKFDTQGAYVRRWVPELKEVPNQWIHQPWAAPKNSLPLVLGKDYPLPIVDHATARNEALTAYQRIR